MSELTLCTYNCLSYRSASFVKNKQLTPTLSLFDSVTQVLCLMHFCFNSALIRPGRFDMQVTVPKPDVKGRTEILNWYLKKIKVDPGVATIKYVRCNQLFVDSQGFIKVQLSTISSIRTEFCISYYLKLMSLTECFLFTLLNQSSQRLRSGLLFLSLISIAIEANVIARGTVGFSGADLENLVNQAALKAAVDGKDMVTMKELEFAKDKILMGEQ